MFVCPHVSLPSPLNLPHVLVVHPARSTMASPCVSRTVSRPLSRPRNPRGLHRCKPPPPLTLGPTAAPVVASRCAGAASATRSGPTMARSIPLRAASAPRPPWSGPALRRSGPLAPRTPQAPRSGQEAGARGQGATGSPRGANTPSGRVRQTRHDSTPPPPGCTRGEDPNPVTSRVSPSVRRVADASPPPHVGGCSGVGVAGLCTAPSGSRHGAAWRVSRGLFPWDTEKGH